MKKKTLTIAVASVLALTMVTTSCIGSFSLTNRVLAWNKQIGSKFVNELVFFAFWLLPVYEVCALADVVVINSIEFWSGENPMAKGTRIIEGEDGRYIVECDEKGYTITSENDGSVVRLDFDVEEQTWSVDPGTGEAVPFMTFIDADHVRMINAEGGWDTVELSTQGVYAYCTAAENCHYASR